jgi:hypothetical protein
MDDVKQAKSILLEALKKGRGFISNYRRSDAKGTILELEYGNGRVACPGTPEEECTLPACLRVRLPRHAEIRCIKNGTCVDRCNGAAADFDILSKGLYRIEVWLGKHAWIYSNPFPVGGYPLW